MLNKLIQKLKHICWPMILALAMNVLVAAESLGMPSEGVLLGHQPPLPAGMSFATHANDITQDNRPIIHDDIWLARGAASFQQRHSVIS